MAFVPSAGAAPLWPSSSTLQRQPGARASSAAAHRRGQPRRALDALPQRRCPWTTGSGACGGASVCTRRTAHTLSAPCRDKASDGGGGRRERRACPAPQLLRLSAQSHDSQQQQQQQQRPTSAAQDTSSNSFNEVSTSVRKLYNAYPFPPSPLIDEAPLGYNWRWHYPTAYAFCANGRLPARTDARILDAGCGTGCGTEYLVHLNPDASVVGFDLSPGAVQVAHDRLRRSVGNSLDRVRLLTKSVFELDDDDGDDGGNDALRGQFDMINCVGMIHHTPDPERALRCLADKLAPGGILHLFVYAETGRWEVRLMQRAIALLQGRQRRGDFADGVALGRALFDALPAHNRLRRREEERWAHDNAQDAVFADMYVHPQEHDYDVPGIMRLARSAGLRFAGWSNPRNFDLDRLLGDNAELRARAAELADEERWRLVELLDPDNVTHFELFLVREPFDTSAPGDDELLRSVPALSECMHGGGGGGVSQMMLDRDYAPLTLDATQVAFCSCVDGTRNVDDILRALSGNADRAGDVGLHTLRELLRLGVLHVRAPSA